MADVAVVVAVAVAVPVLVAVAAAVAVDGPGNNDASNGLYFTVNLLSWLLFVLFFGCFAMPCGFPLVFRSFANFLRSCLRFARVDFGYFTNAHQQLTYLHDCVWNEKI